MFNRPLTKTIKVVALSLSFLTAGCWLFQKQPPTTALIKTSFLFTINENVTSASTTLYAFDIRVNGTALSGAFPKGAPSIEFDTQAKGRWFWFDFYLPPGSKIEIADYTYITPSCESVLQLYASKTLDDRIMVSQMQTTSDLTPRDVLTRYVYKDGWANIGLSSLKEAVDAY